MGKRPGSSLVFCPLEKYVDHSMDPIQLSNYRDLSIFDGHSETIPNYQDKRMIAFPALLYRVIDAAEAENVYCVSWVSHGRAFRVLDEQAFIRFSSPRFFSFTKISSLKRQLNLYGFNRVLQGEDRDSFFHPYFLRGRPDLYQFISRRKGRTHARVDQHVEVAPNFLYKFPVCKKLTKAMMDLLVEQGKKLDKDIASRMSNILDGVKGKTDHNTQEGLSFQSLEQICGLRQPDESNNTNVLGLQQQRAVSLEPEQLSPEFLRLLEPRPLPTNLLVSAFGRENGEGVFYIGSGNEGEMHQNQPLVWSPFP